MAGAVRLMIAGAKPEMITFIKNGLMNKPGIEMIIVIDKPADAENKLSRQALNVLLTDVDYTQPEITKLMLLKNRFKLLTLFTSVTRTRTQLFLKEGTDNFIFKPAVFTPVTAPAFVNALYKRMEGFRNQISPLAARDFNKLAGGSKKVIGIASSTGGTSALEAILKTLPTDVPPLVAVQHMPSGFTKLFADRLNAEYAITIKEAQTGDYIRAGQMLLAPADRHMKLVRQQGMLAVECFVGIKMHGVMPAADVLFESIAELVRGNAVGVILTGMGADGARGMMLMHNAGAKTIGQNKETCVVYGMPKVAKDLGALDFELPIDKIADKILELSQT